MAIQRGFLRPLLACLVMALLLPTAAWADEIAEANRLVSEADALAQQDDGQYREVVDLIFQVGAMAPASKKAANALPLLDQAEQGLQELDARMQSVVGILDKAIALDISPEFRTYLGKEKELMQTNLELYAVVKKLIANERKAYTDWGRLSRSQREDLSAELAVLVDQAGALETQTQVKNTAARQYYVDQNLNEPQASSGTRLYIPGVLVCAVVGLAVGWYRRRRRHRGPDSAQALDEEMRGV